MEELRVSEDQQRRLNQNLTEKNHELHELNHEKDSLMGIVAHDLKAPLNRIRGILELMGLTGELNDDQRQLVQMGQDIIQSGSNLIRDLLDITYYEQGGTKMRWEKLNWNEFLQEHIASFSQDAQKKNIQLQLALPTEPIESITDEDCLSRIFSNLLSNAIKFSPKDRHIFVTLEVLPTQLRLSIKDEGPGFTDEDKRKLFHKFEKLSAKPTAGEASTGLGLSIIKVLTEKLQGSVSLESEGGKGATFILTFAKRN
jgi:signal transduction histidine kinase